MDTSGITCFVIDLTTQSSCRQDSDYLRDHEWLWEHFPPDIRFHSVIVTADNVLTPDTLKLVNDHFLLHIYQGSAHFHSSFFTSTNLLRPQGARTDSSGTMSVTGGFKSLKNREVKDVNSIFFQGSFH